MVHVIPISAVDADDLVGSLHLVGKRRDPENGKQMFVAAGCSACHKTSDEGGLVGPPDA